MPLSGPHPTYDVLAMNDGTFVVSWTTRGLNGQDVMAGHFDSNGSALGSYTVVQGEAVLGDQFDPSLSLLSDNSVLVTFTAGGYYLAFLFPLLTGLIARVRGKWEPGPWNLGRLGTPVAVLAVLWVGFEFTNIVWPRTVSDSWYINWAFFVAMGVILAVGTVIVKTRKVGQPKPGGSAEATPEPTKELV